MMRKTLAVTALMATAGLTLTACGEGSDDEAKSSTPSKSEFNDADVSFAQEMIPHHEQAIEMAQLAQGRASSADVLELAADIEVAQGPEIGTVGSWLESWGEDVPSGDMAGMDYGDMSNDSGGSMSGMMDEEEMNDLKDTSGAAWERKFLEMMIEHHEGAIEMAEVELEDGQNPHAHAMASKIIRDQRAEIIQMEQLLES